MSGVGGIVAGKLALLEAQQVKRDRQLTGRAFTTTALIKERTRENHQWQARPFSAESPTKEI
jgi:hypothetical protein